MSSPRILISPAPNVSRNSTHFTSQITTTGGSLVPAPRKIARKPVSRSIDTGTAYGSGTQYGPATSATSARLTPVHAATPMARSSGTN